MSDFSQHLHVHNTRDLNADLHYAKKLVGSEFFDSNFYLEISFDLHHEKSYNQNKAFPA